MKAGHRKVPFSAALTSTAGALLLVATGLAATVMTPAAGPAATPLPTSSADAVPAVLQAADPRAPGTRAAAATPTTPATAAAAASTPVATARASVFGAGNVSASGTVRADQVIVSWLGISTVAMAVQGHVVLLDTYINNDVSCASDSPPARSRYVPVDFEILVALQPEAVFIGHGHSDHLCRTGELAARTGAWVIGLPEHCDAARAEIARTRWAASPVRCITALPENSRPGDAASFTPLGSGIGVTAVRHLHSGAALIPPSETGGSASVLYRFTAGDFSLVWNDSAGPAREHAPQVLDRLRSFPPTDVELGAILGFGLVQQGLRDPVDYAEALRVATFYPLHHDMTRQPALSRLLQQPLRDEFAKRTGLRTELKWLQDPGDYLRPTVVHQF